MWWVSRANGLSGLPGDDRLESPPEKPKGIDWKIWIAILAAALLSFGWSDLPPWLCGDRNDTTMRLLLLTFATLLLWAFGVVILVACIIVKEIRPPRVLNSLLLLLIVTIPFVLFHSSNSYTAYISGFSSWVKREALPAIRGWRIPDVSGQPLMPPEFWWLRLSDTPMCRPIDKALWPETVRSLSPWGIWNVKDGTLVGWMTGGWAFGHRYLFVGSDGSKPPATLMDERTRWVQIEPGVYVGVDYGH